MKSIKKNVDFEKVSLSGRKKSTKRVNFLQRRSPCTLFRKTERRSCCACEKRSTALNAAQKSGANSCSACISLVSHEHFFLVKLPTVHRSRTFYSLTGTATTQVGNAGDLLFCFSVKRWR